MKSKKLPGWSLAELIIYIAIISIIAGIVVPNLLGRTEEARRMAAVSDIESGLAAALDQYEADNGRFPTTAQGLKALVVKPQTEPVPRNWQGPYLRKAKKKLLDPWGFEYLYKCPGTHNPHSYDLMSFGPDGKAGGEDIDRDVVNWE